MPGRLITVGNRRESSPKEIIGFAPELRLTEDDQTIPAGLYRILVTGDTLRFQRASAADFGGADTNLISLDYAGDVRHIVLYHDTANYTLTWSDPSAARTLTIPAVSQHSTFAFLQEAQNFTAIQTITNTTDNASVQVMVLEGNRATPADGDAAHVSLKLSDSAGNQDEVARISWAHTTVLDGATQDGDIALSALTNGTLTEYLTVVGASGLIKVGGGADSRGFIRNVGTGQLFLSGGPASNDGLNIFLYGASHSNASRLLIRRSSTNALVYDPNSFQFQEDTVIGSTGTLSLAPTAANGSNFNVKKATTLLSALSGATATATDLIPANALLLAVVTRVTTEITGATSFDIGDGSDVDRWGAGIALAAGTTTDDGDYTAAGAVGQQIVAAQSVVLTANGSNFTAGAVRVTVYYIDATAPTS